MLLEVKVLKKNLNSIHSLIYYIIIILQHRFSTVQH